MNDLPPASLGLRTAKLLQGMEPAQLDELARECSWRRFRPGQPLFTRDAAERDVYVIVGGVVRVTTYAESGKQVIFRDLCEGDSLGELTAIDGGRRSADALAVTDVLTASMTQSQFLALLSREPSVARQVMRNLSQIVRLLSDRVFELSTLGVQNRIHAELLRQAREAACSDRSALISPAPRHADIASRVSTTREQVTRELSSLARCGVVEKHPDGLLVPDVGRLEHLVQQASREA